LKRAAETNANLMPPMLDAVRAHATLGEICAALKDVFGTWEERPHI
jgi:methylmalonyl-CoA mutase N-terminal domain/subunit